MPFNFANDFGNQIRAVHRFLDGQRAPNASDHTTSTSVVVMTVVMADFFLKFDQESLAGNGNGNYVKGMGERQVRIHVEVESLVCLHPCYQMSFERVSNNGLQTDGLSMIVSLLFVIICSGRNEESAVIHTRLSKNWVLYFGFCLYWVTKCDGALWRNAIFKKPSSSLKNAM